jgi:hypothetical protein
LVRFKVAPGYKPDRRKNPAIHFRTVASRMSSRDILWKWTQLKTGSRLKRLTDTATCKLIGFLSYGLLSETLNNGIDNSSTTIWYVYKI